MLKVLKTSWVLFLSSQEREERRKRDEIRAERRRQRERERRLETRDGHGPSKKSKLTRDR